MFDWWVVRLADKTGKLSALEWESLTVMGKRVVIPAQSEIKWGSSSGGVTIVSEGVVSLLVKSTYSQHMLKLHSGDMAGTLDAVTCRLETTNSAVVHIFTHQEWLETLKQMPTITHKLLNGMAASVLQIEATLSEGG